MPCCQQCLRQCMCMCIPPTQCHGILRLQEEMCLILTAGHRTFPVGLVPCLGALAGRDKARDSSTSPRRGLHLCP